MHIYTHTDLYMSLNVISKEKTNVPFGEGSWNFSLNVCVFAMFSVIHAEIPV